MKRGLLLGCGLWVCVCLHAALPTKQSQYRAWERAAAVAEAYQQPILAFVTIEDDKATTPIRKATVGHPAFKECVAPNAVFYAYEIPGRRVKPRNAYLAERQKEAPPKPNWNEVETVDYDILRNLHKVAHKTYPIWAVLTPKGAVLGICRLDAENPSFSQFVEDIEAYFKLGNYPFTRTSKLQKALR